MTETDARPNLPFGGKSYQALPWRPLAYMDEYLTELAGAETPYSPDYIRMVKVGLSHFAAFAGGEQIKHPNEIRREHLLRFQAHLLEVRSQRDQKLGLAYRQKLMAYVRSWINWLFESEYIDANPWVNIKVGRVRKKPKPLETDQIAQLFATHRSQAFSIPPFAFHRREVILVLLYSWGLRIHELQALNLSQMPLNQPVVFPINKGGGTKPAPFSRPLKDSVHRWLVHRARYAVPGEDALLIDNTGGRLSIGRIRQVLVDLGQRAGVPVNPHRLRDSFGTTMLDHDVQVELLMAMFGHTQREQTMAYSRVNAAPLIEIHDRVMSPIIDRLLGSPPPRRSEDTA